MVKNKLGNARGSKTLLQKHKMKRRRNPVIEALLVSQRMHQGSKE